MGCMCTKPPTNPIANMDTAQEPKTDTRTNQDNVY